ncbi:MAG: hypothetical protein GWN07_05795, partial [Actinobacteria bacterium]|nr:hypothetical protein [Actinomycetota bacterium]NIU65002.1 hypothetical protein [Actinomycetota bacterium]NIW26808.1 hypothetical protein [Actinomycetota bacterium]NIX19364.1 hypothetical protein [Actinomycetota bacterium]
MGSVATDDARDVAVAGGAAWLADFTGGLRSVDLSDPAAPQIAASVPLELGGIPTDVALTLGSPPFALTSEVFFATASVPIVEVSDPANPLPRFVLDFGVDLNGTGLAVDDNFVYLTAAAGFGENGSTGTSRLLIGQYLGFRDDAGVSPTIELVSPLPGTEVVEGEPLVIEAEASDDVGVFAVRFTVDGEVVFEDRNPLYTLQLPAPAAPAVLTIGAHVLDFAGNRADAEPVEVQVVAPAETSVIGSVADVAGTAVEGAAVTTNLGGEGTTDGGGFFRLDGIPADQGEVVASATAERGGVKLRGRSAAVAPVAGGFTDVGEIRMAPLGDLYPGRKFMFFPPDMPDERAPGWLARGDFNGDRVTDWAGSGGVLGREIGVLHGKGDGTFEPARTVAAELRITNLEAADLNGDGLSDLVAVHAGFDEISVLPSPDFEPSRLPVGDLPSVVAISDLDLDGHPDLVVVNRFSFDLSLLFGLGGGAFAPEVRLPLEDSPEGVIATDLDGGGA